MRKIQVTAMRKIKKAVPLIENRLKVHFKFGRDQVVITGSELNEFLCEEIVRAVDFGFRADDALLLKDDNFVLEFIEVKENTHRKNLKDVRGRLIGTEGKAKKTIENLTDSVIVINGNRVGVIVDSNHLDAVVQAIESLIRGAKHGNVFSYLEKQGVAIRRKGEDDLGLKEDVEYLDEDE